MALNKIDNIGGGINEQPRKMVGQVPTMTGYNTPSGVVTDSGCLSSYYGWKVFDNDSSSFWHTPVRQSLTNEFVQYEFSNKTKISMVKVKPYSGTYQGITIYGSNDGVNYTSLYSDSDSHNAEEFFAIPNSEYKMYKIQIEGSHYNDGYYTRIAEIQLYQ